MAKKAAGGWKALESVARQVLRSGAPLKSSRSLLALNQKHGFDCPGCAWGDPEHASSFEFCENGVKAVAWEATAKTAGPDFFAEHTVESLKTRDGHFLESQGRLTHPMAYDPASDKYVPVSWDEAFDRIGAALRALDHPDQALFYTSGRTSNEAAFLYQLFVRAFGTNNFPDCSNMCHEASGVALKEQIGTGKGAVLLDDFEKADAIFVWGQNPGTNHPRMLADLRKAALRGARIAVFNPLRERGLERFAHPQSPADMLLTGGVDLATDFFRLRPGGDMAAAKGMIKALLAWESEHGDIIDRDFIHTHTDGFERLQSEAAGLSWERIEALSGLTRTEIEHAARIYADAENTIFTWAMGITQHEGAVETIQTLLDLLLLKGNIGRPGAGPCPVRGHSNVQGDRTMGITEHPDEGFLDRLDHAFGIRSPRSPGLATVDAIAAMREGHAKVFFAMGGNFAAAAPDTDATEAALASCKLTAHVSTKLNRSHLVHGEEALILPCLGRTEIDFQSAGPQMVTVEDSMSMVHGSGGLNMPIADTLLSEPAIVAGLAKASLPDASIDWDAYIADYDRIRDAIELVIPGFEAFNTRVKTPGGFYLGNSARDRQWRTETGKARFMANSLGERRQPRAGRFTLMTIRSHDQYNTTVYGLDDRYRGVSGERHVVFIHPDDLQEQGFSEGDKVAIVSHGKDGVERRAESFRLKAFDIPRGNLAAYYPETNVLVPLDAHEARAKTPASKSIPVTLERASGASQA